MNLSEKQYDCEVRKASMRDIPDLLSLINVYASQGIMLPRTEFEISEHIRDFSLIFHEGAAMGCAALHFYSPAYAEVRSLAVNPVLKRLGLGRKLVESLELEAIDQGLSGIFAFTYVPEFFFRLQFQRVERGILPLKVWRDCLRCPKFHSCDEIAVLKTLPNANSPLESAEASQNSTLELPVLPQILVAVD